ncbi:MAG: hypothetical protein LUD68_09130 [Rikenellaceae bacterium]|nr:hypothetical protein [Rikenellaceae bacterium]
MTWHIMAFSVFLLLLVTVSIAMPCSGDVTPAYLAGKFELFAFVYFLLFFFNVVLIIVNQIRISKGRQVNYIPRINFLK